MAEITVDIAVVGAGVVGAAAALSLADAGFRVAVIERAAPSRLTGQLGFDPRTIALSPASRTLLEALGGWPATGVCAYQRMTVWDAEGIGELSFAAAELEPVEPALGYILELSALTTRLWRALDAHPRVQVFAPAAIARIGFTPRGVELRGNGKGSYIAAPVVIGADGANSQVRALAGGTVRARATGQMAIAVVVRHELAHGHTAWQRFLPTGPLAFLPLHDLATDSEAQRFSAVIWSCNQTRADDLRAMNDAQFATALGLAFESRLGAIRAVDTRMYVPLVQQQAPRYQPRPGVVLIGDAAHVVHPLAGQGMNLGLRDVRVLTEVLSRAVDVPAVLAESALLGGLLDRYETRARTVNALAIAFMSGVQEVFSEDHLLARGARNEGLRLVERLPTLKAHVAREAMGRGLLFAP